VLAPVPDALAWISKLAERFGVDVSPHASIVFDEISGRCFGGISFGEIGEQADLPPRPARRPTEGRAPAGVDSSHSSTGLRLVAYRPLFSGAAVERTRELAFQVPDAEVQISAADARARGIRNGQTVTVSSNGTSIELRARIARDLSNGAVRIPRERAGDLHPAVEVTAR
jgi:anaerobic selenocysteine-containing dehydrogenase